MSKRSQKDQPKPKRKIGRPPLLSLTALARFMRFGPSIEECALFFGVGHTTVEDTIKREAGVSFREFREQCRIWSRHDLQREAVRRATKGGSDQLLIFALKNMSNWTDKQQISAPGGTGSGFAITMTYNPAQPVSSKPSVEIPAHGSEERTADDDEATGDE